jgi:hypothetical protein
MRKEKPRFDYKFCMAVNGAKVGKRFKQELKDLVVQSQVWELYFVF